MAKRMTAPSCFCTLLGGGSKAHSSNLFAMIAIAYHACNEDNGGASGNPQETTTVMCGFFSPTYKRYRLYAPKLKKAKPIWYRWV